MTGVRPQTHRSEDETAIPLEARGLVFEVDAARLLDGVDLHARRAELIGVIGPNGAGKSTLLRAFQGVIRAQKGITLLEGHDLAGLSNRDIARVEAIV
ncbi:MAG: ATP-binding cassette domain-containing protein, partial [SAR202 cluster bacterium]|nr:ATP-binding cassette domain-containing protein [SAR202 cluster bacterium]